MINHEAAFSTNTSVADNSMPRGIMPFGIKSSAFSKVGNSFCEKMKCRYYVVCELFQLLNIMVSGMNLFDVVCY